MKDYTDLTGVRFQRAHLALQKSLEQKAHADDSQTSTLATACAIAVGIGIAIIILALASN